MTLPAWLRGLAFANPKAVFGAMFRASAAILKDYFAYKYGLEPGIITVLHTAGSDLKRHPHLHLLITWGGQKGLFPPENEQKMAIEGAAQTLEKVWQSGEIVELASEYLMHHRFLARRWQHVMQTALIDLYDKGILKTNKTIRNRIDFLHFIKSQNMQNFTKNDAIFPSLLLGGLRGAGWVVSIQPPLTDAESIIRYIGRYTKRACLSERKIVKIEGDYITIQYNDYKNTPRGEAPKQAFKRFYYVTFLDALLQHVPEKGFQKVRYYGIYSSGKINKLPEAKRLPAKTEVTISDTSPFGGIEGGLPADSPFYAMRKAALVRGAADPLCCKNCGTVMQLLQTVAATTQPKPAIPFAVWHRQQTAFADTS